MSTYTSIVALAACLVAATPMAHAQQKPAVDRDTIVVAINKPIENLDVQIGGAGDNSRSALQLYDGLYSFDLSGTLIPQLATTHTISQDGLVWRFTLRPGVKFHNGDPLTAADVKFSMERILDPETRSSRRPFFAPVVDKVEAPDRQTVVFRLKERDGAFLNKLAGFFFILPQRYTASLGKVEGFARAPIGSGPWKLVENKIGEVVTFARFDDYWGPKPGAKRLVMRVIDDPANRLNALITGEVDMADGIPPADIARLKANAAFDVVVNPISSPLHIRLYSNRPELPLAKVEVRQALNYAIDQQAIIQKVLHGLGEPLASFFSRHYPYGSDTTLKPYPYDPAKARELLRKAGYPNGFETRLYSPTGWPKELVEVIAAYWAQVGVKTEIRRIDYAAWSRINNTHKTDPMTLMPYSNAIFDPISPLQGSILKSGTWSDYHNPKVEELAAKVAPLTDRAERDRIFKEIGRILHDDAAAVYITEEFTAFGKKKDLTWQPVRGSVNLNFRQVGWR